MPADDGTLDAFLDSLRLNDERAASIREIADDLSDLQLASEEELLEATADWKLLPRKRLMREIKALGAIVVRDEPSVVTADESKDLVVHSMQPLAGPKRLSPEQMEKLFALMDENGWYHYMQGNKRVYVEPGGQKHRGAASVAREFFPSVVGEAEASVSLEPGPSQLWVNCERCGKWRALASDAPISDNWECSMHPDTAWASCSVPEHKLTDDDFHVYKCRVCGTDFATCHDDEREERDQVCISCSSPVAPKPTRKKRGRAGSERATPHLGATQKKRKKEISNNERCRLRGLDPHAPIVFTTDGNPRAHMTSVNGTAAARRYDNYSQAKTLVEALDLGGPRTLTDIIYDLDRGWAKLLDKGPALLTNTPHNGRVDTPPPPKRRGRPPKNTSTFTIPKKQRAKARDLHHILTPLFSI